MENQKINILILQSTFPLGGAEKITYSLMSRMSKEKYNILVCTLYEPGPMGEHFINNGYLFFHGLIRNRFDCSAFNKLNKIIKNNRIDVIYLINQPLTLFWGFIMGKYNNIPIIPVIHNTMSFSQHFKLFIYKLLLPFADRIVAVADLQKDHLVKNEKLPENKIKVIHNGIDPTPSLAIAENVQLPANININRNEKIVGIVSRLVTLKGVDVFLKSAAHICKIRNGVHFFIIGDGPERENLSNLVNELGINERVHFLGVSEDVGKVIPIFDVAVLSSRTEALPMVILEYLACKRPVVATNVGSVSELIIDNFNGYLVPSENHTELAERILILLHDRALSSSFGEAGFKFVKNNFSIESTVKKTEELIDEVILSGRGKYHEKN